MYVYDPTDPVPTVGAATLPPGDSDRELNSGPRDQAEVERRRDVLVYTSESLTAPLQLAGPVHVRLTASTSAKDTDWTANLFAFVQTDRRRSSAEVSFAPAMRVEPTGPDSFPQTRPTSSS